MMARRLAALPFLGLLLACGGREAPGPPLIQVAGAWARAMPAGGNSAVYLTLENAGGDDDRLLGGEVEGAEGLEVHESRLEGDVMRMRRVDGVDLPTGAGVAMEPGGLHLMILGLQRPLEEGDTVSITLRFERSQPRALLVPVRAPGGE